MSGRPTTDLTFIATVYVLCVALMSGLALTLLRAGRSLFPAYVAGSALIGWLVATAYLSSRGMLSDFSALPPRVALVIVPSLAAAVILGLLPATGRLLPYLPPTWPIGSQVFRVAIEIVLWALAKEQRLPVEMTLSGRNFDVLTGLTALPMAWWASRGAPPWARKLWNWAGILLVTNVAATGFLSAPTRFQMFHTMPPNTIIATFPFVWLPCIAVATAYFLHIISLRQTRSI